MSDMNGLGIVVEHTNSHQHDILLPPLPTETSLKSINTITTSSTDSSISEKQSINNSFKDLKDLKELKDRTNGSPLSMKDDATSSANNLNLDFDDEELILPQNEEKQMFSHSNHSFSTYELDSPSINLDSDQLFPITKTNSNTSESEKASPLKRLKKTIRKLSLSKNATPTSTVSSTPVLNSGNFTNSTNLSSSMPLNKKDHYPTSLPTLPTSLPTSFHQQLSSQLSSLNESYKDSGKDDIKQSQSSRIEERPQLSPLQNTHFKTVSQDSNNSSKSSKSLDSKLKHSTPTTPSSTTRMYSSPTITISDNFQPSNNIERLQSSYLANCNLNIEELNNKLENLVNYYNYLINEKININEGYNVTKSRLIKSGWCSDDDLNNLNLQKNFQLNQIDLKLIEINDKLSKD